MNLLPTDEQQALVDAVRTLATSLSPAALARGVEAGSAIPATTWTVIAEQGWFGLGLPEAAGGVGYGIVEEALLLRELGRQALPGPVLPTMLAAHVAAHTGLPELLAALLSGERVVGWLLPGGRVLQARAVQDRPLAGLVSLSAEAVTLHRPPDALDPRDCVDAGATLDLSAAPAGEPLGASPDVARAQLLLAALASGVSQGATEASVRHASTREQFGKPIGAFQAVKHRCADMAVRAEAAWTQTAHASLLVSSEDDESGGSSARQVAAAVTVALDAASRNAADNVQNHGGMGFTWESDAHLFVGRARTLEALLPDRLARRTALLG